MIKKRLNENCCKTPTSSKTKFRIRESAVDNDAIQELTLYAENDSRMYDVLMKTYLPALKKFKKKGTYDPEKAIKLLEYYYQNYVRPAYKKEFGDDIKLNPAERKLFSKYFLDSLEMDGYLDESRSSKSHKILESYIRKAVVQELSNRRRKLFEYDDDDEFEDAEPMDEPMDEDYIISDSRSGGVDVGVVGDKHLAYFEEYDDAVKFIRKHADRSKFWPNAWYETERGRIEGPIEY